MACLYRTSDREGLVDEMLVAPEIYRMVCLMAVEC